LSERLLSGIDWEKIENVLEPQAGKGNIVHTVMEKYAALRCYGDRRLNVDCVEIDPYLRSILHYEFCGQRMHELNERIHQLDKKKEYDSEIRDYRKLNSVEAAEYRSLKREQEQLRRLDLHIVHDDFHTFQSRKHYDLIAMNPPFADGDAHLLKAIELQRRSGGMIRCILNAETIRNPYTNRRRFLVRKLQELEAEIKYVEGAFSDSERRTDVEVALITINIPAPKRESTIFDRLRRAAEVDEPTPNNVTEMTVADFMGQIVSRFNVEVDAGIELIREYEAMKPYILESFEASNYNYPSMTLCVGEPGRLSRGSTPSINEYLRLKVLGGPVFQQGVCGETDQQSPGRVHEESQCHGRFRFHAVQHPADSRADERRDGQGHPGNHCGAVRQAHAGTLLVPGVRQEYPLLQRLENQ
jgi:hypothetical protein